MPLRTKIVLAGGFAAVLIVALGIAAVYFALSSRVEGEYFNSNGVLIHYTDQGQGTPVILVHGFAVHADINWRRPGIIDALAKSHRVIAMDLRGHGLSGKPHDPAMYGDEMAQDVIRLMDHLNIRKAHVVGYSLGGFVALKCAVSYPHRLLGIAPLGAGWETSESSEFIQALPRVEASLRAGKGIPPLSGQLGPDRKKPGFIHTQFVRIMTKYFNDPIALADLTPTIGALTLDEHELKSILVPVCSIIGSEDSLKPGADALEGRIRNLHRLVIPGADHMNAAGRPELIEFLKAFIDRYPAK